jgi:hypothetical protein
MCVCSVYSKVSIVYPFLPEQEIAKRLVEELHRGVRVARDAQDRVEIPQRKVDTGFANAEKSRHCSSGKRSSDKGDSP